MSSCPTPEILSDDEEECIKADKKPLVDLQAIRAASFQAAVLLRQQNPACSDQEREALGLLAERVDLRPDSELLKLPTFTQYWIDCIERRPMEVKIYIKNSSLFHAFITDMDALQWDMKELSKQTGLYNSESDEFKDLIATWWMRHKQIHATKSFMCYRFGVPPPNPRDLIPERLYLGVLLNEEDYAFFLARNMIYGMGVRVEKGENEETYGDDLRDKSIESKKNQASASTQDVSPPHRARQAPLKEVLD
jgi:hypothetical protein